MIVSVKRGGILFRGGWYPPITITLHTVFFLGTEPGSWLRLPGKRCRAAPEEGGKTAACDLRLSKLGATVFDQCWRRVTTDQYISWKVHDLRKTTLHTESSTPNQVFQSPY